MGQYYGPDFLRDYMMAFWDTENWLLYEDWNESKQKAFDDLYGLPFFHSKFDQLLSKRDREYYLRRNGMDYSDVRDPRKLTINGTMTMALNFVSDNIKRLYH